MFSVRIVSTSHYQADPLPQLDVVYSSFRSTDVRKVPVLRIFGATPAGQKTCMHVHGVFPYLYVPFDGTQPADSYLRRFAASLDKAINVANNNQSNSQHVFKISLVAGIPMYGYHADEQQFLKIYLYNPKTVRKAADLLLGGAVMNKSFQPHEAHIPFPLQLFIDYNLYGMNLINVAAVKFRRRQQTKQVSKKDGKPGKPSDHDDHSTDSEWDGGGGGSTPSFGHTPSSSSTVNNTPSLTHWDMDNIPSDMLLPASVERESGCELEVDVVAADILNRQEVTDNMGSNPGLAALWEDERQRRRDVGQPSQITPPDSQEHDDVESSESERDLQKKLAEIIQQQTALRRSESEESEMSLEESTLTPEDVNCMPASQLEDHSQSCHQDSQESLPGSQGTVVLEEEEDEGGEGRGEAPIISLESIQRVVSFSQSFSQPSSQPGSQPTSTPADGEGGSHQSLVDVLAALAEESSPSCSQRGAAHVSVLEDQDSVVGQQVALPPDPTALQEDMEETLHMSQPLPLAQDEHNVEGLDVTWDGSPEDEDKSDDQIMESEDENEDDDDIPQLDGASDQKSVTKKTGKKRLGVRGPVLSPTQKKEAEQKAESDLSAVNHIKSPADCLSEDKELVCVQLSYNCVKKDNMDDPTSCSSQGNRKSCVADNCEQSQSPPIHITCPPTLSSEPCGDEGDSLLSLSHPPTPVSCTAPTTVISSLTACTTSLSVSLASSSISTCCTGSHDCADGRGSQTELESANSALKDCEQPSKQADVGDLASSVCVVRMERLGKLNRVKKLGLSLNKNRTCSDSSPSPLSLLCPEYSFTFHVPTPVSERCKLQRVFPCRQPQDLSCVRMHPTDAKRFSLVKVGQELVRIRRLTIEQLSKLDVVVQNTSVNEAMRSRFCNSAENTSLNQDFLLKEKRPEGSQCKKTSNRRWTDALNNINPTMSTDNGQLNTVDSSNLDLKSALTDEHSSFLKNGAATSTSHLPGTLTEGSQDCVSSSSLVVPVLSSSLSSSSTNLLSVVPSKLSSQLVSTVSLLPSGSRCDLGSASMYQHGSSRHQCAASECSSAENTTVSSCSLGYTKISSFSSCSSIVKTSTPSVINPERKCEETSLLTGTADDHHVTPAESVSLVHNTVPVSCCKTVTVSSCVSSVSDQLSQVSSTFDHGGTKSVSVSQSVTLSSSGCCADVSGPFCDPKSVSSEHSSTEPHSQCKEHTAINTSPSNSHSDTTTVHQPSSCQVSTGHLPVHCKHIPPLPLPDLNADQVDGDAGTGNTLLKTADPQIEKDCDNDFGIKKQKTCRGRAGRRGSNNCALDSEIANVLSMTTMRRSAVQLWSVDDSISDNDSKDSEDSSDGYRPSSNIKKKKRKRKNGTSLTQSRNKHAKLALQNNGPNCQTKPLVQDGEKKPVRRGRPCKNSKPQKGKPLIEGVHYIVVGKFKGHKVMLVKIKKLNITPGDRVKVNEWQGSESNRVVKSKPRLRGPRCRRLQRGMAASDPSLLDTGSNARDVGASGTESEASTVVERDTGAHLSTEPAAQELVRHETDCLKNKNLLDGCVTESKSLLLDRVQDTTCNGFSVKHNGSQLTKDGLQEHTEKGIIKPEDTDPHRKKRKWLKRVSSLPCNLSSSTGKDTFCQSEVVEKSRQHVEDATISLTRGSANGPEDSLLASCPSTSKLSSYLASDEGEVSQDDVSRPATAMEIDTDSKQAESGCTSHTQSPVPKRAKRPGDLPFIMSEHSQDADCSSLPQSNPDSSSSSPSFPRIALNAAFDGDKDGQSLMSDLSKQGKKDCGNTASPSPNLFMFQSVCDKVKKARANQKDFEASSDSSDSHDNVEEVTSHRKHSHRSSSSRAHSWKDRIPSESDIKSIELDKDKLKKQRKLTPNQRLGVAFLSKRRRKHKGKESSAKVESTANSNKELDSLSLLHMATLASLGADVEDSEALKHPTVPWSLVSNNKVDGKENHNVGTLNFSMEDLKWKTLNGSYENKQSNSVGKSGGDPNSYPTTPLDRISKQVYLEDCVVPATINGDWSELQSSNSCLVAGKGDGDGEIAADKADIKPGLDLADDRKDVKLFNSDRNTNRGEDTSKEQKSNIISDIKDEIEEVISEDSSDRRKQLLCDDSDEKTDDYTVKLPPKQTSKKENRDYRKCRTKKRGRGRGMEKNKKNKMLDSLDILHMATLASLGSEPVPCDHSDTLPRYSDSVWDHTEDFEESLVKLSYTSPVHSDVADLSPPIPLSPEELSHVERSQVQKQRAMPCRVKVEESPGTRHVCMAQVIAENAAERAARQAAPPCLPEQHKPIVINCGANTFIHLGKTPLLKPCVTEVPSSDSKSAVTESSELVVSVTTSHSQSYAMSMASGRQGIPDPSRLPAPSVPWNHPLHVVTDNVETGAWRDRVIHDTLTEKYRSRNTSLGDISPKLPHPSRENSQAEDKMKPALTSPNSRLLGLPKMSPLSSESLRTQRSLLSPSPNTPMDPTSPRILNTDASFLRTSHVPSFPLGEIHNQVGSRPLPFTSLAQRFAHRDRSGDRYGPVSDRHSETCAPDGERSPHIMHQDRNGMHEIQQIQNVVNGGHNYSTIVSPAYKSKERSGLCHSNSQMTFSRNQFNENHIVGRSVSKDSNEDSCYETKKSSSLQNILNQDEHRGGPKTPPFCGRLPSDGSVDSYSGDSWSRNSSRARWAVKSPPVLGGQQAAARWPGNVSGANRNDPTVRQTLDTQHTSDSRLPHQSNRMDTSTYFNSTDLLPSSRTETSHFGFPKTSPHLNRVDSSPRLNTTESSPRNRIASSPHLSRIDSSPHNITESSPRYNRTDSTSSSRSGLSPRFSRTDMVISQMFNLGSDNNVDNALQFSQDKSPRITNRERLSDSRQSLDGKGWRQELYHDSEKEKGHSAQIMDCSKSPASHASLPSASEFRFMSNQKSPSFSLSSSLGSSGNVSSVYSHASQMSPGMKHLDSLPKSEISQSPQNVNSNSQLSKSPSYAWYKASSQSDKLRSQFMPSSVHEKSDFDSSKLPKTVSGISGSNISDTYYQNHPSLVMKPPPSCMSDGFRDAALAFSSSTDKPDAIPTSGYNPSQNSTLDSGKRSVDRILPESKSFPVTPSSDFSMGIHNQSPPKVSPCAKQMDIGGNSKGDTMIQYNRKRSVGQYLEEVIESTYAGLTSCSSQSETTRRDCERDMLGSKNCDGKPAVTVSMNSTAVDLRCYSGNTEKMGMCLSVTAGSRPSLLSKAFSSEASCHTTVTADSVTNRPSTNTSCSKSVPSFLPAYRSSVPSMSEGNTTSDPYFSNLPMVSSAATSVSRPMWTTIKTDDFENITDDEDEEVIPSSQEYSTSAYRFPGFRRLSSISSSWTPYSLHNPHGLSSLSSASQVSRNAHGGDSQLQASGASDSFTSSLYMYSNSQYTQPSSVSQVSHLTHKDKSENPDSYSQLGRDPVTQSSWAGEQRLVSSLGTPWKETQLASGSCVSQFEPITDSEGEEETGGGRESQRSSEPGQYPSPLSSAAGTRAVFFPHYTTTTASASFSGISGVSHSSSYPIFRTSVLKTSPNDSLASHHSCVNLSLNSTVNSSTHRSVPISKDSACAPDLTGASDSLNNTRLACGGGDGDWDSDDSEPEDGGGRRKKKKTELPKDNSSGSSQGRDTGKKKRRLSDDMKPDDHQDPDATRPGGEVAETRSGLVLCPRAPPPSRKFVEASALSLGLSVEPAVPAFCSHPPDLPDTPRELGGRVLRLSTNSVKELEELPPPGEGGGLGAWQTLCASNSPLLSSQPSPSSPSLAQRLQKEPQLRFVLAGDQPCVITPVRPPPHPSRVTAWLADVMHSLKTPGRRTEDEKEEEWGSGRGAHLPQDIDAPMEEGKSREGRESSDEEDSMFTRLRDKPIQGKEKCKKSARGHDHNEDTTEGGDSSTPKRQRLESDHILHSTPVRCSSTELFESGFTPIGRNQQGESSRQSGDDTGSEFVTPRRPPLRRLSTNTQSALRRAVLSADHRQQSFEGETSQIDMATPKNAHGFKVTQQNLQDAKALHKHQFLTVLSMELHADSRGDLMPDPEVDAIRVLFYSVFDDIPPESGRRNLTGAIVVDKESYKTSNSRLEQQPSTSRGARKGTGRDKATLFEKCGVMDDLDVTYVQTEQELLNQFVQLTNRLDPDILLGFEIQQLSWGFLLHRASHLSVNLASLIARIPGSKQGNRFSAEKDEWGADHSSEIHIEGRIVLNLWRILRHEVTLNIYSYENCAFHILHRRVPAYTFRSLTSWYDHRTQLHVWRVVDYYTQRVRGELAMLDQLDIIGKTSEFARVFGIEFYDVLSRGSQYRVESMMLRLAKPLNFIPVSPSVQQRARQKAAECIPLTLEPQSRMYTDPVVVLDFQSLYPSIMIAYNYCFSTCLGRLDHLQHASDGPIEFGCTSLNIPPQTLKKLRKHVTISPNGCVFATQKVRRGVLPMMVEEILKTRLMVKKSMKDYKEDKTLYRLLDARQLGLKLIANVTYGYTGASFSGRMPCIEVGDSIVRKARESLERAIQLVKDTAHWRAQVVYGDTDSLFIKLPGRSKDEAFVIGQEIADAVTNMFPKPMKLKFEKVYLPCALQTKKRYVGFMYETRDQKEPVFDAKGIETVRRDNCGVVSKVLERCIKILFTQRDVSQVRGYLHRQLTKMLAGRAGLQDYVFAKEYRGMMGYKPGACVPALEIARRRLREDGRSEPRVGERVPYVIVHGSPGLPLIQLVRQPRDLLRDPSLRINVTYYITKQVLPPLDRLLSLVGVSVFQWYNDMPKVMRVAPHLAPSSTQRSKQGTISQYFVTSDCLVCERQTKQTVCEACLQDPQMVAVTLAGRSAEWEHRQHRLAQVCKTCMGVQDNTQPCVSLHCPVLFRRHLATQDLARADLHRDAMLKLINF